MIPKSWKEQVGEFMRNVGRVNATLDHIYKEVQEELQIEDVDGYPGGLLGALNKICDFRLEDLEKEVDPLEIDDDWREIKRQHLQVKFLRMLVIVQLRSNQGWKDGGRNIRTYPDAPAGYMEKITDTLLPKPHDVPLMNGQPVYVP